MLSVSSWQSLPENPGVYLFKGENKGVLYIGKAINLKKRVSSYFEDKKVLGQKTQKLVSEVKKIFYIPVESEIEALLLEANLIKKYQPKYNVNFKDGKAYPFIKITISEDYPRITTSRRIENEKDLFFGPYPDSKTLYFILKTIRRIFPYRSCQKIPRKPCLYYHLERCPGFCINDKTTFRKKYKNTVKKIILFLEGKKDSVLQLLNKEMIKYANLQKYEEAQIIKNQIERIKEILKPIRRPFEYIENPNLIMDIRTKEINYLYNFLETYFPPPLLSSRSKTFRIECYDISNIYGKNATGSMVVFTNGNPDKSQYRRFRIKFKTTPADLLMLREVLQRRFRHKEWPYPNLIVIDGGDNQVRVGLEVLREKGLKIPVIGFAKRSNSIYIPVINAENLILNNFKVLHLSPSSIIFLLLKRIIDEAHRFALFYHRKLRQKMLL